MLVIIVGYACTGKTTLREFLELNSINAIEASDYAKKQSNK